MYILQLLMHDNNHLYAFNCLPSPHQMSLSLAPFPRICSHLCPGMYCSFIFISTRPGMETWTRSGPSLMLCCHLAKSEFSDENKIDCIGDINAIFLYFGKLSYIQISFVSNLLVSSCN